MLILFVYMVYLLWPVPVRLSVLYAYPLPATWLIVAIYLERQHARANRIIPIDRTDSDRAEIARPPRRLLPERCLG